MERLDEQIDEHTTFTKTIVKHTENVKQEIQFTNSQVSVIQTHSILNVCNQLNAKNKEMETEDHLKKLAQRETVCLLYFLE